LIGEEVGSAFKTYHFDCRGSTIAITDTSGNITDTFAYDTYGKLISRTGTSEIIFGYNGRDGVVTDDNGLIYMRARYYSPNMKRFINADIIPGKLSNAITLNRFAYANGNPVSFIDPFGLSVWSWLKDKYNAAKDWVADTYNDAKDAVVDTYNAAKDVVVETYNDAKQAIVDTYNEVTDWAVDTYNDVKERVVNTYNDTKDFVIDKYNDAKDWVDEKIVQPVTKAVNNVKEDIQNYDKNNTDEQKVLNSHYFSSYEGKLVIRTDMDRSGSFGVLFITHETNNRTNPEDVIRHEHGHTKQLDQLGIINYALFIGLPSWQEWSSDYYYDRPWEVTADTYGEVQSRTPSQAKIDAGEDYLDIIKSNIPIWEKIAQLSQYYN
jgi:RHS repeat-associated protein